MKKFSLCAVALLLTAFSVLGQGVKIQAFTTNSGPVVTNIVVSLSSNLLPNRLLSTNTITGVRVFAATNGAAAGFWLDPATITPGQATNVISVAAGTGINIVTNVLLRTISTPAVTNNETRQITFQGAATLKDGSDNSLLAGQRKLVTGARVDLDWFNHILNHTEAANDSWLGSAERMTNAPVSILRISDGRPLTNGTSGQALLSLGNGGVYWGSSISGWTSTSTGIASDTPNPISYNTNGGTLFVPGGYVVTAGTNVDGYFDLYVTNGVGVEEDHYSIATKPNRLVIANDVAPHEWEANFNRTNGNFTAPGFIGNAAGLTNLPAPWVTVGITNGDYGPFTPGTTTSGIQEAIDSFPKGTNGRPNGVYLKFGIGNYFFTNRITYSNNWDYQMVWEGVGKYATRWVYAGQSSGINAVEFKGGGNPSPSLNCSGTVKISDGVFSAIYPTTNVLLCITNENSVFLQRVNFSSWKSDTVQDWLSTTSGNADQFDYTITTNGLVGAVLGNVNDAGVKLEACEAGYLAVGIVAHTDHLKVYDFIDPSVGLNVSSSEQTAWPITHPYRTGAGIIRYPGLDAIYQNVHAYSDKTLIALMNYPGSTTEIQQIHNLIAEGGTPVLTAILTNGNVWTVDSTEEAQGSGIFSAGNTGRINTNDFSTPVTSPISLRGVVYNSPAYLVATVADGGVHLRTGEYAGNGRGLTNLPGITPVARVSRNTNTFTVVGSKSANLDGIWHYNSTLHRYTNASYSGTAAYGDLANMTFTNAAHPLPDFVAVAEYSALTNTMATWTDNNFDPVPNMIAWWSETTNNEAFIDGRLKSIVVAVGAGGGGVPVGETTYMLNTSSGTVTLPDIRTNAGRIIFVKADNGVTGSTITTTLSQALEGGPISVLPGETYGIQALNGAWKVISKFSYSAAGLTNYGGIKVYRALLSQSGSAAPVATVLENSIGAIVWARSVAGTYTATLTGAFTANKTFIKHNGVLTTAGGFINTMDSTKTSANVITIHSAVADFGIPDSSLSDDILSGAEITILVYP